MAAVDDVVTIKKAMAEEVARHEATVAKLSAALGSAKAAAYREEGSVELAALKYGATLQREKPAIDAAVDAAVADVLGGK